LSILGRGKWALLHTPCRPSHVSHAQLDKDIWSSLTKFLFGGCMDITLHAIWEHKWNFHPRPQSSGKIFFWIVGIKATSPSHQALTHAKKITDYHSTLAASTLNILFLEILKISKIFFSTKNNFVLWRKIKHLLNILFQHGIFKINKLFKRHALKLP
jgi:hypothetical protein